MGHFKKKGLMFLQTVKLPGRHLVRWKSEHEKNLRAWMDPADVDEMIQSVLEEILI